MLPRSARHSHKGYCVVGTAPAGGADRYPEPGSWAYGHGTDLPSTTASSVRRLRRRLAVRVVDHKVPLLLASGVFTVSYGKFFSFTSSRSARLRHFLLSAPCRAYSSRKSTCKLWAQEGEATGHGARMRLWHSMCICIYEHNTNTTPRPHTGYQRNEATKGGEGPRPAPRLRAERARQ